MYLDKTEIKKLNKINRLNLINSITGIKTINLIGTVDKKNVTNLAVFSSIVHISSDPALLGFFVRTNKQVKRDTLDNIIQNKVYTINLVNSKIVKQAHYTSAKFDKNISEFDKCSLKEQYINNFIAPYVAESKVKIGLKLKEIITINSNNSNLIVGEIEQMHFDNDMFFSDQTLDLEKSDAIGISGLNKYYKFNHLCDLPYARISELPKF